MRLHQPAQQTGQAPPTEGGMPLGTIGLLPSRQGYHLQLKVILFSGRKLKREKKKDMKFSQDLNLHLLNVGQMFLTSEPLELWQWS